MSIWEPRGGDILYLLTSLYETPFVSLKITVGIWNCERRATITVFKWRFHKSNDYGEFPWGHSKPPTAPHRSDIPAPELRWTNYQA
jgi:hypothetical protein